ncbi:hypothetical protein EMIT048CA2_60242 [Pseudomonas chlororaphis]
MPPDFAPAAMAGANALDPYPIHPLPQQLPPYRYFSPHLAAEISRFAHQVSVRPTTSGIKSVTNYRQATFGLSNAPIQGHPGKEARIVQRPPFFTLKEDHRAQTPHACCQSCQRPAVHPGPRL